MVPPPTHLGPRTPAPAPLAQLVETGRAWLSKLRLRALLWTIFFAAAGWAVIVLTTVAWLPVVGFALAATAVSVNKVAGSLGRDPCIHCGHSLSGLPASANGIPCPSCGGLTMRLKQPTANSRDAEADEAWQVAATAALDEHAPASAATAETPTVKPPSSAS